VASSGTEKLGILAGVGLLPVLVARAAKKAGYEVEAFGFKGMMDQALYEDALVNEFPFCQLGALFTRVEQRGINKAVTIGSIAQTSVIGGMPQFDDLALDIWKRLPDRRVDTIMEVLVEELSGRGIEVVEALSFLSDHLAEAGELTDRKPSDKEWEDIRFGFKMAKAIGGLDIGQTVVVKHRAVMAVEAVEGTDECIKRGGELAKGGGVVVKVAKPGQDMRFDVPTVGRNTLENMKKHGCSVLAIEAGSVLMVEREALTRLAEDAGICMVSVSAEGMEAAGG